MAKNPSILNDVLAIQESESMEDLVATYNALTGKSIKSFLNVTIARRKTEMAHLAAKDADAKTGIPPNVEPKALPREEIVKKARGKKVPVPDALDSDPVRELKSESLPAKSFAAEVRDEAVAKPPVAVRPKKDPSTPRVPRGAALLAVVYTGEGVSKPQAGSTRTNVLEKVKSSIGGTMLVADLDAHFAMSTRGYLQKLIELKHLKVITPEEYAAARSKGSEIPAPPAKKKAAAKKALATKKAK